MLVSAVMYCEAPGRVVSSKCRRKRSPRMHVTSQGFVLKDHALGWLLSLSLWGPATKTCSAAGPEWAQRSRLGGARAAWERGSRERRPTGPWGRPGPRFESGSSQLPGHRHMAPWQSSSGSCSSPRRHGRQGASYCPQGLASGARPLTIHSSLLLCCPGLPSVPSAQR